MPKQNIPGIENLDAGATSALKEDIAAYRTDQASGETDHTFENWIKVTRPERWETYLKVTGRGK